MLSALNSSKISTPSTENTFVIVILMVNLLVILTNKYHKKLYFLGSITKKYYLKSKASQKI